LFFSNFAPELDGSFVPLVVVFLFSPFHTRGRAKSIIASLFSPFKQFEHRVGYEGHRKKQDQWPPKRGEHQPPTPMDYLEHFQEQQGCGRDYG